MGPMPERQVALRLTSHVEPIGVGEPGRVAIGGREHQVHQLSLTDRLAADRQILSRLPIHELDRPVVAEELLDSVGNQRRLLEQQTELVGVAQQSQQAVADQVRGRLMTGRQEQIGIRDQLRLAEPIAVNLGLDQQAQ